MRRCSRCLYDETLPAITFDADGMCSYCHSHDALDREYPLGAEGARRWRAIADRIRRDGRGRPYDVVIGVSGGCDSSYLLHVAREAGLRPLAVHFDNTWNSAIATTNIQRVLKALDIDLETYVVHNEEYDDIYRSFLKAGVPDLDAPTDIGLAAVLYRTAEKYRVRYIFDGHSFRTEGVSPLGWLYMDGCYIASVQRRHGTMPIETFPNLWLKDFVRWATLYGIKRIRPLYYVDYRKAEAMKLLTTFGWRWYGGHHLENRITAFYQSYFGPRRLRLDFRLLGYSALIRSGQMERSEGLALIAKPQEFDPDLLATIKKRLGFSDDEFDRLMTMPMHSYREYPTYKRTFERLRPFFWLLYKMDRVPKSFYMKFTAPDHRPLPQPVGIPVLAAAPAFAEIDKDAGETA